MRQLAGTGSARDSLEPKLDQRRFVSDAGPCGYDRCPLPFRFFCSKNVLDLPCDEPRVFDYETH